MVCFSFDNSKHFDVNIAKWSENYRNNISTHMNPMTVADEDCENLYMNSLNQLVSQLRDIVTKDLEKKMVQNSAYCQYDNWWSGEQNKNKVRVI